jgi:ankyrin repeat protein
MKLLLNHGAKLESQDKYGRAALSRAEALGSKAVVKFLREHAANPN